MTNTVEMGVEQGSRACFRGRAVWAIGSSPDECGITSIGTTGTSKSKPNGEEREEPYRGGCGTASKTRFRDLAICWVESASRPPSIDSTDICTQGISLFEMAF